MISLKKLQRVAVITASFTVAVRLILEVILPLFYKQKTQKFSMAIL